MGFVAELKRRKVIRVAGLYLVNPEVEPAITVYVLLTLGETERALALLSPGTLTRRLA